MHVCRRARLSAPDGGGEDIQIEEWQRALQKAGGIKLKDNPAKLKKALKRQERKKKKSSTEWSSRIKTVRERSSNNAGPVCAPGDGRERKVGGHPLRWPRFVVARPTHTEENLRTKISVASLCACLYVRD